MFFENKDKLAFKFKLITIYIMAIFYINVGIGHFINPDFFLVIVPDYLPYHLFLVYISGLFEIIFGFSLLFKKSRKFGAIGLIFLLILVFPANIFLFKLWKLTSPKHYFLIYNKRWRNFCIIKFVCMYI